MSLKMFHVFFIFISIVLCVVFGVWAVKGYLYLGITAFVLGALLTLYLLRFLSKRL